MKINATSTIRILRGKHATNLGKTFFPLELEASPSSFGLLSAQFLWDTQTQIFNYPSISVFLVYCARVITCSASRLASDSKNSKLAIFVPSTRSTFVISHGDPGWTTPTFSYGTL